jgi:hypothetical protein
MVGGSGCGGILVPVARPGYGKVAADQGTAEQQNSEAVKNQPSSAFAIVVTIPVMGIIVFKGIAPTLEQPLELSKGTTSLFVGIGVIAAQGIQIEVIIPYGGA